MIFSLLFEYSLFKNGWNELWHVDTTDLTSAAQIGANMVNVARNIRAYETLLEAIRISQFQPGVTGPVSRLIGVGQRGTRPQSAPEQYSPIGTEAEDLVQTAADMLTSYMNNAQAVRKIRGLFDGDVTRDTSTGSGFPSAALRSALDQYVSYAAGASLGSLSFVPGGRDAIDFIEKSPNNPNNTFFSVPQLAGGLSVGDKVRFGRVPKTSFPWLKGVWTVAAAGITNFEIAFPYPYALPFATPGMYVAHVVYRVNPVLGWKFLEFGSRKTGRPTRLTRGRSSGVKYRRSLRVGP